MNVTQENRDLIIKEFLEISQDLQETKDPNDFLYFFSAAYGILNRVMNIQCEPILVFMHQILLALHQGMQARFQAAATSTSNSMAMPGDFFEKMKEILVLLGSAFQKGSEIEIYSILSRAANLTYAGTGNGYYLYLRQKLKI